MCVGAHFDMMEVKNVPEQSEPTPDEVEDEILDEIEEMNEDIDRDEEDDVDDEEALAVDIRRKLAKVPGC